MSRKMNQWLVLTGLEELEDEGNLYHRVFMQLQQVSPLAKKWSFQPLDQVINKLTFRGPGRAADTCRK